MTPAMFYRRAQPLVERLLTMARDWRDAAPADPRAISAHGEFLGLAVRTDIQARQVREEDDQDAPDIEPLDTLIGFVGALRSSRGGHLNAPAAHRRLEALQAAHDAVEAAGEGLAELLLAELVAEAQKLVDGLEERNAKRRTEDRSGILRSICEMERHAADADGGWSDYGISDLYRDTEVWAAGRVER